MASLFLYTTQPEINKVQKPPDLRSRAKRARPHDIDEVNDSMRKSTIKCFKSKLLNTSNPGIWHGFCTDKDRLKIEQGDVTLTDGSNDPTIKLSEKLKLKLCKPWENTLILKTNGNLEYGGKPGLGDRLGSESPVFGAENSGKSEDNRK
ncbi:hypothetical protein Ddye_013442 [Dipteronia dyeriana]|uniref:Uncharacterized protein n=1 Tax=Dipteronia dyeriana TaxID=168575 RepID=A0AAD9X6F3_9ROSI|nr:hypothetical protein Ddye_013442 [Dipteronia dyeriana]